LAFIVCAPADGQLFAQSLTGATQIKIDAPIADSGIGNGAQVDIGGWALDPAGPGTGVDAVRVYLDGPMDAGGTLLGNATYGKPRPDVGVLYGSAYVNSGYDYVWTPRRLSPGPHRLYVYAHSIANGWQSQWIQINGPTTRSRQAGFGGPGSGQFGSGPYGNPGPFGAPLPPPPPPPPPPIPPFLGAGLGGVLPAPATLTVTGTTGTTVTLTWTAVPGAVSYRVLQSIAGGPFTPSLTTPLTTNTAFVTGLTNTTVYRFQVVAVDAFGNQSLPSIPAQTTTLIGP